MRATGSHNRKTLAVTATPSEYSSTVLYLRGHDATGAAFDTIHELSVYVEQLPASAEVEVDLLRAGGNPQEATHWLLDVASYTGTGLQTLLELAAWYGVRIRAKSGGTAGNVILSASWW